jgi:hypothetical protein
VNLNITRACKRVQRHLVQRVSIFKKVPLSLQIIWLFLLAIPIACIAWTITHEEIFREQREWCLRQSELHSSYLARKFFFIFACEYCFSHYVTIFFLALTRYKLLFDDWRGYVIGGFALVWVANQYMSLYAHLRLDIRKERVEIKHVEQKVRQTPAETEQQRPRAA